MNIKRILCMGLAALLLSLAILPAAVLAAGEETLSVGKKYTIEYESSIDNAFPGRAYRSENKLTDGKFAAAASYSDPAFLLLYRGTSVSVTIDLEEVCAVSSVEVHALQLRPAGIYSPRYVYVALSEDGKSFGTVGSLYDGKTITQNAAQNVTQTVTLDKTYRGRYVRVTFSSDVNTYVDEVVVKGTKGAGSASAVSEDPAPAADRGFANQIDGIGNIVLLYTIGNYTEQELLPYIAYVDEEGNTTDTMFDAALFLPSGASNYDYSSKAGWDNYVRDMFGKANNCNLTALNSLVRRLRTELSLGEDFRYPVFLSVPFLEVGNGSFYGISPINLDTRAKILMTFIDQLLQEFKDANLDCLELKGLYWHEELIQYAVTDYEEELMKQFNAYVHEKGLKTIWIPYYCAPGFERAVELGFDAATLQSGYAFKRTESAANEIGEVQPGAVEDSAAMAKKYGLGMEFELDTGASDCFKRYYKYLQVGYSSGCMDGHMMMIYQSVKGLLGCAYAGKNTEMRRIYELTYLYNKGKFSSIAPSIPADQIIVAEIGSRSSGSILLDDPDSSAIELRAYDIKMPDDLVFAFNTGSRYIMNTAKSLAGLYTVTFRFSDGFNSSDEASLKVLLIDPAVPGKEKTLDKEVTLYAGLNTGFESVTLPAGTALSIREVEGDWYYVAYTDSEGKDAFGFADGASIGEKRATESEGSPLVLILIVVGVVVVAVIVIAVIFITKKQKNKGGNAE